MVVKGVASLLSISIWVGRTAALQGFLGTPWLCSPSTVACLLPTGPQTRKPTRSSPQGLRGRARVSAGCQRARGEHGCLAARQATTWAAAAAGPQPSRARDPPICIGLGKGSMRWDRSGTRSGPRTRAERTCGSLARHEAICRHREPQSSPPHSLSRCPLRPTLLPRQRAADCRAQSWATPAAARANTPRRGGASRRPRRLRGQCKPASKTPVATKVGGPQPRLTGGGDPRRRREQRERPPAAPFAQTGEEGARTQRTLERRLVVDFVAPSSAPFRFARRAVFPKHKSPFVRLAAGARHGFVMLFVLFWRKLGSINSFPFGRRPQPRKLLRWPARGRMRAW